MQVLYFDGCPNYETLAARLRGIVDAAGKDVVLETLAVESEDESSQLRFLGSPTVRVNGHDVERGADDREDFGLKCRLYRTPRGVVGAPPEEWIVAAIRASLDAAASQ